jgi:hypothetical protein
MYLAEAATTKHFEQFEVLQTAFAGLVVDHLEHVIFLFELVILLRVVLFILVTVVCLCLSEV